MREIQLTKGHVVQVDDVDYDMLMQWKWSLMHSKGCYYARRDVRLNNLKGQTSLMHRLILGLTDPKIHCDHNDGNGLNNQKYNLRKASCSQNAANRKSRKNSSSMYHGVYYDKRDNWWVACVGKNSKWVYHKRFRTEDEAGRAYNEAALKYHGEFARLNIIPSDAH